MNYQISKVTINEMDEGGREKMIIIRYAVNAKVYIILSYRL